MSWREGKGVGHHRKLSPVELTTIQRKRASQPGKVHINARANSLYLGKWPNCAESVMGHSRAGWLSDSQGTLSTAPYFDVILGLATSMLRAVI
jgi:hypothetical protein